MNKSLIGGVVVLIVLALVGFVVVSANSEDDESDTTATTSEKDSSEKHSDDDGHDHSDDEMHDDEEDATVSTVTASEVAMHSSEDDCWTIINGKVYNLTTYLPRHPGGSVILQACGADGTSLFTERETTDGETVGSGTPHSGNATAQLQDLFVGDLEN